MFLNGKCQIEKWLFFLNQTLILYFAEVFGLLLVKFLLIWRVSGYGWLSNWCRKVSLVRLQTMGDIQVRRLVLLLKELLSLLLLKPRLIDKALLLLKPRLIDKALLLLIPRLIDIALLLLKPRLIDRALLQLIPRLIDRVLLQLKPKLIDKALLLLIPRLIDRVLLQLKPKLIDKANPHILGLTVSCSLASQTWTCG